MASLLDAPRYHTRWHRRPMSVWWWLESWRYTRFVLRELTSVCVAWTSLVIVGLVWALGAGSAALAAWLAWLASPWVLALHVVVLAGLVYHSLTWCSLAPSAMVVRVGGRRVPAPLIVGANLGAWAVASLVIVWLVVGRQG